MKFYLKLYIAFEKYQLVSLKNMMMDIIHAFPPLQPKSVLGCPDIIYAYRHTPKSSPLRLFISRLLAFMVSKHPQYINQLGACFEKVPDFSMDLTASMLGAASPDARLDPCQDDGRDYHERDVLSNMVVSAPGDGMVQRGS